MHTTDSTKLIYLDRRISDVVRDVSAWRLVGGVVGRPDNSHITSGKAIPLHPVRGNIRKDVLRIYLTNKLDFPTNTINRYHWVSSSILKFECLDDLQVIRKIFATLSSCGFKVLNTTNQEKEVTPMATKKTSTKKTTTKKTTTKKTDVNKAPVKKTVTKKTATKKTANKNKQSVKKDPRVVRGNTSFASAVTETPSTKTASSIVRVGPKKS